LEETGITYRRAGRAILPQHNHPEQWIGPVSSAIVVIAALWYFYRVFRILRGTA
jgi:hypothetical protein